MPTLREGDLELDVPSGVTAWKFDGATHQLSHCMKAVDFVIEESNKRIFVEIKDGDASNVPPQGRANFVRRLQRGELDQDLYYKCRDSFLYGYCAEWTALPTVYYVVLALESLTSADLTARTTMLESKLPLTAPEGVSWTPYVERCQVFNLATWNRYLPQYPLRRV